jgi:uncharacterized protein (DUF849 family)
VDPLIIEVAINGGTSRTRNPNVPKTPDEVVADASACLDAGATIIHTHIEDLSLTGQAAADRYLMAYRPILAKYPKAILYGTIAYAPTIAERCAHTEIMAQSGATRMAFIDPGSTNVGIADENGLPKVMERRYSGVDGAPKGKTMGSVYVNPYDDIDYMFRQMDRHNLGPGISIYEPNFLRTVIAWHRARRLPPGAFVKFYMAGDYNVVDGSKSFQFWGLPPTRKGVEAYRELLEGTGLPWAVATLGGDVTDTGMSRYAIENGGHIRLGLEDYGGPRQPRNVELVEQVVAIARKVGRPIAAPAEAEAILGLPPRH